MSFAEAKLPDFQGNVIAMASHGSDRNLQVEFFIKDEFQPFESEKEGRQIYKSVEMIHIVHPGAKSDIILRVQAEDLPNAPSHPNRFPRQYAAFKAQLEQVPDGTPLEMCKFIASHRVKELKAQNIHTAEQLSSLPDSTVQTLGMGAFRERDLAKAYIGTDDDKVSQLSKALAEKKAMEADIEVMKQQLAQLNSHMGNQLHGEGRIYQESVPEAVEAVKRRGRPKKED